MEGNIRWKNVIKLDASLPDLQVTVLYNSYYCLNFTPYIPNASIKMLS